MRYVYLSKYYKKIGSLYPENNQNDTVIRADSVVTFEIICRNKLIYLPPISCGDSQHKSTPSPAYKSMALCKIAVTPVR